MRSTSPTLVRCLFVAASLATGGAQAATFGELAGSGLQQGYQQQGNQTAQGGGYAQPQQRYSPWGNRPQGDQQQQGSYYQQGGGQSDGQGWERGVSRWQSAGARTSWQSGYPAGPTNRVDGNLGYGQTQGSDLERSTAQVITRRGDGPIRTQPAELANYSPKPQQRYHQNNYANNQGGESTARGNSQELVEPDGRLRPYDYRRPGGNEGYAAPDGSVSTQNPYESTAPVNLEPQRYPYTTNQYPANQPQQQQPEYYVVRAPANGANSYPPPAHIYGSYGQASQSNPYNYYGLQRGARVVVPWSTPMSSWVNQQKWEWWRQRAGDQRGYGMYSY